jgi:hypothetical protein
MDTASQSNARHNERNSCWAQMLDEPLFVFATADLEIEPKNPFNSALDTLAPSSRMPSG